MCRPATRQRVFSMQDAPALDPNRIKFSPSSLPLATARGCDSPSSATTTTAPASRHTPATTTTLTASPRGGSNSNPADGSVAAAHVVTTGVVPCGPRGQPSSPNTAVAAVAASAAAADAAAGSVTSRQQLHQQRRTAATTHGTAAVATATGTAALTVKMRFQMENMMRDLYPCLRADCACAGVFYKDFACSTRYVL